MKYNFVVVPTIEINKGTLGVIVEKLKRVLHRNIKLKVNGRFSKKEDVFVDFLFGEDVIRLLFSVNN